MRPFGDGAGGDTFWYSRVAATAWQQVVKAREMQRSAGPGRRSAGRRSSVTRRHGRDAGCGRGRRPSGRGRGLLTRRGSGRGGGYLPPPWRTLEGAGGEHERRAESTANLRNSRALLLDEGLTPFGNRAEGAFKPLRSPARRSGSWRSRRRPCAGRGGQDRGRACPLSLLVEGRRKSGGGLRDGPRPLIVALGGAPGDRTARTEAKPRMNGTGEGSGH